jgi:hypothetical protein
MEAAPPSVDPEAQPPRSINGIAGEAEPHRTVERQSRFRNAACSWLRLEFRDDMTLPDCLQIGRNIVHHSACLLLLSRINGDAPPAL